MHSNAIASKIPDSHFLRILEKLALVKKKSKDSKELQTRVINELKKAAQSLGISSLSSYHLEYKERQQKLLRAPKKVSVQQCKIAIQLILCCNRIILNAIYTKYCDLSIGPTHASSIRIGTPNTTNETPTATSGSTQWDVPIFPANAVLSTGPFLLELLN